MQSFSYAKLSTPVLLEERKFYCQSQFSLLPPSNLFLGMQCKSFLMASRWDFLHHDLHPRTVYTAVRMHLFSRWILKYASESWHTKHTFTFLFCGKRQLLWAICDCCHYCCHVMIVYFLFTIPVEISEWITASQSDMDWGSCIGFCITFSEILGTASIFDWW